jgi:hypothetical protein
MISRFNYTGRTKLRSQWIRITVHEDSPRRFDAELNFQEGNFPPDAAVYLEATSSGSATMMRFDFGTVASIAAPPDRVLTDVSGEHVIFTVKVVDRTQHVGRILGLADGIRPKQDGDGSPTGRRPILPVNPVDLGQRIWKLTYTKNDVYLDVNKHVPEIKEIARGNHLFFGLVYPEVIRQILERLLLGEGHFEPSGDDEDWRDLWLRYGISWHPEKAYPPRISRHVDEGAREEAGRWIEDVVDAFCEQHRVRDAWIAAAGE